MKTHSGRSKLSQLLRMHLNDVQDYLLYQDELELVMVYQKLGAGDVTIAELADMLSETHLPFYRFLIGKRHEQREWIPFEGESFESFARTGVVKAFNNLNSYTDKKEKFKTRCLVWLRRNSLQVVSI